ncbi:TIGR03619 family F420-dependent LLM class oxidoreductase [Intrasporangium sp.]|uniref:TIGR03619 family F420-dependent LLM class oxidoreductase n=1 Tax=Intrasporangium sp. TaxID=1925024 RepID=UPI00293A5DE9|nr:TIGR03619 family F420-dependent LLM class oxidoreductase [Intrasporangium sp.]MDV3222602.1 TIGR03619 family F420-dependent LLM class oxidoreductase [Intrasporangium sp.]
MRFCVSYSTPFFGTDPDRLLGYARHAEELGFEGIYLPEHVVGYRGARIGGFELPPDLDYADPLDCLSFIAAGTERLLLGTGVLLLPYHHPVTLAKRLATIDRLSRGRLRLLTIGLGALPGEAEAVGVDFASRGRRADEAIQLLRLLWSGDVDGVGFDGEFFTVRDLVSYPKPYGSDPLPIHVGGSSRAAARRAGRFGDGFLPGGAVMPQERARQWDLARSTAAEAGRDPNQLEYTRLAPIDMTEERYQAYLGAGVDRVVVSATTATPDEQHEELARFAERFDVARPRA